MTLSRTNDRNDIEMNIPTELSECCQKLAQIICCDLRSTLQGSCFDYSTAWGEKHIVHFLMSLVQGAVFLRNLQQIPF